jgi:hypothetical protein
MSPFWAALSRSLSTEFTCANGEPFWTTTCKQYFRLAWSILILLSRPLCAQDLPAATTLEARLSTSIRSRVSHAGDQVEGRTIGPIGSRGQILFPQGSRLQQACPRVWPFSRFSFVSSADSRGAGLGHKIHGRAIRKSGDLLSPGYRTHRKYRMTAERRARIIEATRRRWAASKKAGWKKKAH